MGDAKNLKLGATEGKGQGTGGNICLCVRTKCRPFIQLLCASKRRGGVQGHPLVGGSEGTGGRARAKARGQLSPLSSWRRLCIKVTVDKLVTYFKSLTLLGATHFNLGVFEKIASENLVPCGGICRLYCDSCLSLPYSTAKAPCENR